jgi:hypothetical protein
MPLVGLFIALLEIILLAIVFRSPGIQRRLRGNA